MSGRSTIGIAVTLTSETIGVDWRVRCTARQGSSRPRRQGESLARGLRRRRQSRISTPVPFARTGATVAPCRGPSHTRSGGYERECGGSTHCDRVGVHVCREFHLIFRVAGVSIPPQIRRSVVSIARRRATANRLCEINRRYSAALMCGESCDRRGGSREVPSFLESGLSVTVESLGPTTDPIDA
jgi:hypothetical protein